MTNELSIDKQQQPGGILFLLGGSLDSNTSPLLEDDLIKSFDEVKAVDVDLGKLEYISSAGLRVLLAALKKSMAGGVPLKLKNLTAAQKDLFDMVGFTELFDIQ